MSGRYLIKDCSRHCGATRGGQASIFRAKHWLMGTLGTDQRAAQLPYCNDAEGRLQCLG